MARRRKDGDIAFDVAQLLGVVLVGVMCLPGFVQAVYGFWALVIGLLVIAGMELVGLAACRIHARRTRVSAQSEGGSLAPVIAEPETCTRVLTSPASSARKADWSLAKRLRSIDWFQFEKVMVVAYQKLGYAVTKRGGANPDGGIDLIIEKDGSRSAIQCKHWKSRNVGVRAVRELLGAMTHERIGQGKLLTLFGYSRDAKTLADEHQITILTEPELARLLEASHASYDPEILAILEDTSKCCPKCGALMEIRTARKGPSAGEQFWGCSKFPRCWYKMPLNPERS